jgi:hypothetical protein
MAGIDLTSGSASAYGAGELQLQNKVQMTATLTPVTDNLNTASPLKLSTSLVQTTSTLKITTADNPYLDAEDNSGNNRFTIGRDPASQQVNLDFASNPTGSTTAVGAIRTYRDGVNLSEAMTFIEDGSIGIGTNAPIGLLHLYKSAAATRLAIDGDAGQNRLISYRTGALQRFGLYVNNTAESGSNAGSNFAIRAYNDAGTLLTTPFFINRATGNVGILNTNPLFALDVNGTINAGFAFNQGSANANTIAGIINQGGASQAVNGINCIRLNAQLSAMVGAAQNPTATLHIKGSGSTSATTSLLVQNSGGTDLLKVTDDGNVFMGSGKNLTWNTGNFIVGDTTANTMTFYVASGVGFQIGASTNSISRATSTRELFPSSDNNLDFGQQFARYRNGWFGGQLKVGDATAVNASAKVQIDSTTQGFLPPRMTTAQKVTLAATATAGLMIYDTNLNKLCVYTGAGWETITSI